MKIRTRGILLAMLILGVSSAQAGFWDAKKEIETQPQSPSVPFPQMMSQLSADMTLWSSLNADDKMKAIDAILTLLKNRDNVAILNSSDFYSKKIDETLTGNTTAMNMDLMQLIKLLSIMEYDYYNGQNKEELAKEVLGEKVYEANNLRRQEADKAAR